MFKRFLNFCRRLCLWVAAGGLAALLLPRLFTALHAASRAYTVAEVPARRVAIVFGAGLWRDGTPTPVLRDRVTTAAELYFAGKAEVLLMSGDNRFIDYNEPAAMRAYALQLGVPAAAIVLDYAGRRTYDTCYRAQAIFGVQSAILVTQGFHLPRALYTCNALGVDAVGVASDRRQYRRSSLAIWTLRELPATLTALWEVHVAHPLPVLGEPEPIFPIHSQ
jgi:SanA protein